MRSGALVEIAVPFSDSSAGALGWALGLAPLPALATRRATLAARSTVTVELRVLGASHQVVVESAGGTFTETVACHLAGAAPLPRAHRVGGYHLATDVRRLSPAHLSGTVEELLALLGEDPHALVTRFPGHPDAVTALRLRRDADGPAWETWHAYPQTGELVTTRSSLAAPVARQDAHPSPADPEVLR